MQPFTHSKSTSITGFTEVGVHPERERGHQDGIHACNPSKRCPFHRHKEGKKGIEEQWINLTIVGKRTNMVGERTKPKEPTMKTKYIEQVDQKLAKFCKVVWYGYRKDQN